ncbi:PTS fructose transporter subunit IIA [Candidatus Tenderia electrophaga]|jgi:PTS system ascorbate-specific IIA component|uniref:PTS fructose transporter subunit IIA n=1 Tax=Candidatus Tenderia electrophaga TaxID=1748243 RepID=A0A0S2T988_9GAMM|nr:PTS fructose transporter subunit IIA [Candidatus Tenderia electrophaga]
MSAGLLIIAHDNVGQSLMETASEILGMCPMALEIISVCAGCEPDDMIESARSAVRRLDSGGGVLILTDMYGSTPSNVANRLGDGVPIKVVAGLNMPMLVRVLNYPSLSLDELVYKAITGGQDGIFVCDQDDS